MNENKPWVPEPAESFGVDYINRQGIAIADKIIGLGFAYTGSGFESGNADVVVYRGEKEDGTKITIRIEKGAKYKSPVELAYEENEARGKK